MILEKHNPGINLINDERPTSQKKWQTIYENTRINQRVVYGNVVRLTKDTFIQ